MCAALARADPGDSHRLPAYPLGRQLCPGALHRDYDAHRGREGLPRAWARIFSIAASVVAQWYLDQAQSVVRDGRAAGPARGGAQGVGGKEMKAAIFRGGDIVV